MSLDFATVLTNRTASDRHATDFYPTPPLVTQALLGFLQLPPETFIWECACGEGHIAEVLKGAGYEVSASDLHERGYGDKQDFLGASVTACNWIITNPPFSAANQFIEHALSLNVPFAFLLKSQYWHAASRLKLFTQHRPSHVLPLTWRPDFLMGAKSGSPTMECVWTVWQAQPSESTVYHPLQKPAPPPGNSVTEDA